MTRIERTPVAYAVHALETGFVAMCRGRSAEEIDRAFPGLGAGELWALAADRDLPVEARAKVVQVALLRGGRENRVALEYKERLDPGRRFDHSSLAYQRLAVEAVLGEPALFEALSAEERFLGRDRVHPASQWLEIAAGPRGWLDVEAASSWMKSLPPETRGRAWFHLHDAAHEAAKGTVRVRSGQIGVGAFEVDLDYVPKDDAWASIVKQVAGAVKKDLDRHPAEAEAFARGLRRGALTVG